MKKTLMQLLADNRRADGQPQTRIVAAKKADEPTTVFLYDAIVNDKWLAEYFGAVYAGDLVLQLEAIEGDILLRVNCPGGDVFGMKAVMTTIRGMKDRVKAQIDGLCASAATAITSVCASVTIGKDANYMIHNAQGISFGDHNDHRRQADVQEKVSNQLADVYAEKTGKDLDDVRAMMDEETWLTAEQAVEHGFVDALVEETSTDVKALGGWKLTAYAKAPKQAAAPAPEPVVAAAPAAPAPAPEPELISEEHSDRIRQRLRVAALLDPKFTSAPRAT